MFTRLRTSCCTLLAILALAATAFAADPLLMATTTSTDDTGLLNELIPAFTKATGIELNWTAKGTGAALKLGENCDVDVLMVHAPAAEKKFVEDGFGIDRTEIMYNDFVLVGPKSDPAAVKGKSVAEALKIFGEKKTAFVSRGDDSGTHKLELSLWKKSDLAVPDKEPWYLQSGQGMMATLDMAAEKGAYTIADRGTWIAYADKEGGKAPLAVLVEGDKGLLNQYSVIAVNPAKCPKVKIEETKKFMAWVSGPEGQKAIGDFKLKGKQLFTPNAKK